MAYPCICDSHTHTRCSPDASDTASMMCEAGERAGLYAMTITDHCECNLYQKEGYNESIRRSYLEARQATVSFYGRLRVLTGVELGQPLQDLSAAEDVLGIGDFDFVLGSVHNIAGYEDFYFLDYQKVDPEMLISLYLDEVEKMVEWGGFDSLAHITYPLRYITGENGIEIDRSRHDDQVNRILKKLAESGKALEVNTSGLRQKIGVTLPTLNLVRRFKEYGGKYVTLGSDSHRWKDVGAGIPTGLQIVREAGFTHYTLFEKRSPKLIPIEGETAIL